VSSSRAHHRHTPSSMFICRKLKHLYTAFSYWMEFFGWTTPTISQEVDEISIAGAVKLVNYFKSHAKRVYSKFNSTPEERQIKQILDWIRKNGGVSTVREIQMNKVGGVKRSSEIIARFNAMQDMGQGLIEKIQKKTGGRPIIQFRTNA